MFKIYLIFLLSALLLAETKEPIKIKLQFLWKNQFEFAGFYIAKEKGFYKKEGLNVKILEYKHGVHVAEDVANRKVDFGVIYSDILLNEDELKNIVLLNALLQSSPHVLVSLKSSGIKSIKDFPHKRIMINEDAKKSAAFIAMLKLHGVSLNDMIPLKPTFDINSLLRGETDIMTAYRSNELYILDQKGVPCNVWDPKDYGFDLYSDLLITSKTFLHQHPDIVEKFRRASLKGFEYAFSHIDETVDLIMKKYNSLGKSREALVYEANVLKKLAYQDGKKLGDIDKNRIQRIIDIYRLLGLMKGNIDVDELIYKSSSSLGKVQKHKQSPRWMIVFVPLFFIVVFLLWRRWRIYRKENRALRIYAFKDPLTNLYNRRYLNEMGLKMFLMAKREKKPFSIVMIDIDDFKKINDQFGHPLGDRVLQTLSNILLEQTRRSDIVGRYGGEEFIVFLPNTSAEGAWKIAQKIKKSLQNKLVDEKVAFTVSFGISQIDFQNDSSLPDIIQRADEALYEVKKSGKNDIAIL